MGRLRRLALAVTPVEQVQQEPTQRKGRLKRLTLQTIDVEEPRRRKGRLKRLALARQVSIASVGPVHVQQFRKSEEYRSSKVALLEALLKNWQNWRAILEDSGVETLVIGGEEWNFYDMLDGIKELPPRQKQALWKILIEDKRPVDVAREMFAGESKRIVGEMAVQYKDDALAKLIARHEQQKEGYRGGGK